MRIDAKMKIDEVLLREVIIFKHKYCSHCSNKNNCKYELIINCPLFKRYHNFQDAMRFRDEGVPYLK